MNCSILPALKFLATLSDTGPYFSRLYNVIASLLFCGLSPEFWMQDAPRIFSGRNKGIGVCTTLFSDYYGHQIPVMTRNRWKYLPFSHRVA
jgi:hypothetical protein